MIGHFPAPLPDELFYSQCARYQLRAAHPYTDELSRELFGTPNAESVFDLPGYLGEFVNALPPNTCFTKDGIIERFTLLPYYKPFISPEVYKQAANRMIRSSSHGLHTKLGLTAARIEPTRFLRYCTSCFDHDTSIYGERYWRRSHQAPGVHICQIHGTALTISDVRTTGSRDNQKYIAAQSIEAKKGSLTAAGDSRVFLQKIAQASGILLNGNFGPFAKSDLSEHYKCLLFQRDLATPTGSLRVERLITEFTSFYPAELLRFLGCKFTGKSVKDDNWLLRMLRKPESVQHPLYHILLIGFLDCRIEDFLKATSERPTIESNLFGQAPWRCLNPAASHHKKRVIRNLQLSSRSRSGRIAGSFTCHCGFIYSRSGPDASEADEFRIDKMVAFGRVWESELKRLVEAGSFQLTEIAGRLKVDPLTIKRHAAKMEMTVGKGAKIYKQLGVNNMLKTSLSNVVKEDRKNEDRLQWQTIIESSPEKSLKDLRLENPTLYSRLRRDDYNWLKDRLPGVKPERPNTSSVDWGKRDVEVAARVRRAGKSLLAEPGRPQKISRTRLGKEAGCLSLVLIKLDKLPLTEESLKVYIESSDDFAVRKIDWHAKRLKSGKRNFSESELLEAAGVYSIRDRLRVKNKIKKEISGQALKVHS